jgi:aminobenzoyl-glutamate transport protein
MASDPDSHHAEQRRSVFSMSETAAVAKKSPVDRFLDVVEWAGNKLPDPAMLFVFALGIVWLLSFLLCGVTFAEIDPRTLGSPKGEQPIHVINQLTPEAFVKFLTRLVKNFTEFPPLGLVLVALLGVSVAEHSGFINAMLRALLKITPRLLVTPMVLFVAILSHSAGDTGFILVIPLGGVIFQAVGRHPLAGIATAAAGVSGGFSANFLPSSLDPLLQGFTQSAVRLLDPNYSVNPLCNWTFTSASSVLVIGLGWLITEWVVEPRLKSVPVDGDPALMPTLDNAQTQSAEQARAEQIGMWAGLATFLGLLTLLVLALWPQNSPLRSSEGSITDPKAPMMAAIVPVMFFMFLLPGVVHGFLAGTFKTQKDVIDGMTKSVGTMSYYLVMVFFAAQFVYAFGESNLGALLALKGAVFLQWLQVPPMVTIVGVILVSTLVNLLIGSASAKWALLAPIFVPMLMQVGISPELTQAAYRIGDSCTNIITPLMPYFPLMVMFGQRYVTKTGIGTMVSLMLPYSITFLICWTTLLLVWWQLGMDLGISAKYVYP